MAVSAAPVVSVTCPAAVPVPVTVRDDPDDGDVVRSLNADADSNVTGNPAVTPVVVSVSVFDPAVFDDGTPAAVPTHRPDTMLAGVRTCTIPDVPPQENDGLDDVVRTPITAWTHSSVPVVVNESESVVAVRVLDAPADDTSSGDVEASPDHSSMTVMTVAPECVTEGDESPPTQTR